MVLRSRVWVVAGVLAMGAATIGGPAAAQPPVFPDVVALPNGWLPEGIAVGDGSTFYAGSRADGAVYSGDLRTGLGDVLVPGTPGRIAVGLEHHPDCDVLLVAGGPTGQAYVYDASSGDDVAVHQLATATPTFVNDVAVAGGVAYFTDSNQAVLYRLDLATCGATPLEPLALSGEWEQVVGFNANGIIASPDGTRLIVVNSTTGGLFSVDPLSGVATRIDAPVVPAGDGLLLAGKTLYVVQNRLNQIAGLRLDSSWSSASLVGLITDADFDVPTTIARFGHSLYAVNGRFTTPPTPDTPYQVVRVDR